MKINEVDKETIFVEGVTDKAYLEMTINVYSSLLSEKIERGELQIVTREENGCGTSLLVDWAIAWMHMNYKSKAVFLLDADKEGKEAKKSIKEANEKYKKKNYKLKALLLKPTEDMKVVNRKINNAVIITIEHLLSYDFWKMIKAKGWTEDKNKDEILSMFGNVMDIKKSLDSVIDELIDNTDMKDTVIYLKPNDDKREKKI